MNCGICNVEFAGRGQGRFRYCSELCSREARSERDQQQRIRHRDRRIAYDRAYYLRRDREREKASQKRYRAKATVRQKKQRALRRALRLRARDLRADAIIAGKEIAALNWHLHGQGMRKDGRGRPPLPPNQKRQSNKETHRAERAAIKMYRAMGFSASRKDRRQIYRAMKAELGI